MKMNDFGINMFEPKARPSVDLKFGLTLLANTITSKLIVGEHISREFST